MRKHIDPAKILPLSKPPSKLFVDLTGRRFGRLTVIGLAGKARAGYVWNCRCDCGHDRAVLRASLTYGGTQSCGCRHSDAARLRHTKHGGSGTVEYGHWENMVRRCNYPKADGFEHYGGRGIAVCQRWRNFANFYADMGPRPSPKHSIERRNNNGNYEPDNCYWATRKEQMRNMRRNHLVTFNGETLCISEWTEKLGLSINLLLHRLKRGWSAEKALTTPIQVHSKRPR